MWQATHLLVETMSAMQGFLNDAYAFHDAQAAGHNIRETGTGKDANYTLG